MSATPTLSVIIASYNSKKTIADCLKSLEKQRTHKYYEIIVVDSSTDGTGKNVEKKFPFVKVLRFSKRKFAGDARNIGISEAKGKIVAFIDSDCIADENWIEEVHKAHESPHLAIGGAIANANPESYTGWAAYFTEFSQWMPETLAGRMHDIAGANMSYKKEVFENYGGFIEGTYCSDTNFHWRLGNAGHRLQFVPSIRVSHINIDSLEKFIKHEFFHGRCFAGIRKQSKKFTGIKRLIFTIFSPLIPIRLLMKVGSNNLKNKIYIRHFLKSLPLLMVGLLSWSLGETVGYIDT